MLARIVLGQSVLTHFARLAIPTRVAVSRGVALTLVVLALLILRPALSVPVLPFGDDRPPTMHDPLRTRVRYVRTLVADADYALALTPRVITVWRWHIAVLPAQPDPQRAWDDTRRIAPVVLDQPDVLSTLWSIQRAYERLSEDAIYAQQAHAAYTPDYTPVHTLLDVIDTDLTTALAVPSNAASNWGSCPICVIE